MSTRLKQPHAARRWARSSRLQPQCRVPDQGQAYLGAETQPSALLPPILPHPPPQCWKRRGPCVPCPALPTGSPGPPRDVLVTKSSSELTLWWTEGHAGGAPTTGYVIEARPSGKGGRRAPGATRCPTAERLRLCPSPALRSAGPSGAGGEGGGVDSSLAAAARCPPHSHLPGDGIVPRTVCTALDTGAVQGCRGAGGDGWAARPQWLADLLAAARGEGLCEEGARTGSHWPGRAHSHGWDQNRRPRRQCPQHGDL